MTKAARDQKIIDEYIEAGEELGFVAASVVGLSYGTILQLYFKDYIENNGHLKSLAGVALASGCVYLGSCYTAKWLGELEADKVNHTSTYQDAVIQDNSIELNSLSATDNSLAIDSIA